MSELPRIRYALEPALDLAEFRRVLEESGLGTIRPIGDAARLQAMLDAADLILTARLDDAAATLVGVARGITDFAWCCYLSELAVTAAAQGLGVGKGLLEEARRQLGPEVSLILASVPEATGFYRRIGMAPLANAFWFKRTR